MESKHKGDDSLKSVLARVAGIVLAYAVGLVVCLIIGLCVGCSPARPEVRYLTETSVEIVRDTVLDVRTLTLRDTVRIERERYEERRDSVAPILDSLDRMIGLERWHWQTVYESSSEERARYESQLDSLRAVIATATATREPYPVEVPVEFNRLYWWQKFLMTVGTIAMAALLALLAFRFYRLFHT